MEEFLSFVFYALLGYIAARIVFHYLLKALHEKNEKLKQELVDLAKQYIFVKPERHGDMIYLFETDTDRFIAQGRTAQEIKAHCQQRFPDKNVVISSEYLKQYAELSDIKS
jgi:hypothetical protein